MKRRFGPVHVNEIRFHDDCIEIAARFYPAKLSQVQRDQLQDLLRLIATLGDPEQRRKDSAK